MAAGFCVSAYSTSQLWQTDPCCTDMMPPKCPLQSSQSFFSTSNMYIYYVSSNAFQLFLPVCLTCLLFSLHSASSASILWFIVRVNRIMCFASYYQEYIFCPLLSVSLSLSSVIINRWFHRKKRHRPTDDRMEINKEHNESDRKILEAINVERHFAGWFFIYLFVCLCCLFYV